MFFVFYFLWFGAIGKVLLGPTLRLTTKVFFVLLIGVGIWIVCGGMVYQSQYSKYLVQKKAFEAKKQLYIEERKKLERAASIHPTSRDLLLHLATIAYQTGDKSKLLDYIELLRQIDPNNERVQQFIQSVQ